MMFMAPHIHPSYPQREDLFPGECLGPTAGRLVGKVGAVITFTKEGPNPDGNYWFDPDMRIDGNHYVWKGGPRKPWMPWRNEK